MKILPSKLTGEVKVISSKSVSHRYVMAASLANGESIINNILNSDDLVATTNAMKSFGAVINGNKITGTNKLKYNGEIIDCNESGSTLRFLIPISLLLDKPVVLTGRGRLGYRPQSIYIDLFKGKYQFDHPSDSYLPLTLCGPLEGGEFHVAGNVSSQFITGLLYALPLVRRDSKIIITTPLESRGYVDLTLEALELFGIKIIEKDNTFIIPGKQQYKPQNLNVEGDYSQAAFWIVAGLLNDKQLVISNLNFDSKQGDMQILELIKQMGANIEIDRDEGKLIITPTKLSAIEIDLAEIPDLGPILMVLASRIKGTTKFINTQRLRIKESDRVQAMYEALTAVGVDIIVNGDDVIIKGSTNAYGTNKILSSHSDHRIAMAISILALNSTDGLIIDNHLCVNKSYPTFFEELKKLGGNINE